MDIDYTTILKSLQITFLVFGMIFLLSFLVKTLLDLFGRYVVLITTSFILMWIILYALIKV